MAEKGVPLGFKILVAVCVLGLSYLLILIGFTPQIDVQIRNITPIEKWGPLGVNHIPVAKRSIRFAYEVVIINLEQANWEKGYPEFSTGTGTEVVYVYKSGGVCILTNDYTKAVEYFNQHAPCWLIPKRGLPGEPK